MEPVLINLDPMTEGDDWDGIPVIGPITFQHWDAEAGPPAYVTDDAPGNLTRARLTFARQDTTINVLDCDSDITSPGPGEQTIVIDNSSTWALHIHPMGFATFPLTAGTWEADFEFFYGSTSKKTLYRVTQVVNPRR